MHQVKSGGEGGDHRASTLKAERADDGDIGGLVRAAWEEKLSKA